MCLPGNFMTHRQFENIVPLLEKEQYKSKPKLNDIDERKAV